MTASGIHLILLGAPGVGKGTQARQLMDILQAVQISTGDILRNAVKNGSPLGREAQGYMTAGQLVPDTLILQIIKERLMDPDFAVNWMMDGFPRNRSQAEALDQLLAEIGQHLTAVIDISVPVELLMDRLTLRRTCRSCGVVFNLKFNPPAAEGICNDCGGELYQRSDDGEEAVRTRLGVYQQQTQPLIGYYQDKGLLFDIRGDRDVKEVTRDILAILKQKETP